MSDKSDMNSMNPSDMPSSRESSYCEIDIVDTAKSENENAFCALVTFKGDWLHQQPELIDDYHFITELITSDSHTIDIDLNLQEVTNISSYSLGWFFSFATRLRDRGRRLVLKNPNPGIYQTLKLVQLDDMASIQNPPPPEALEVV